MARLKKRTSALKGGGASWSPDSALWRHNADKAAQAALIRWRIRNARAKAMAMQRVKSASVAQPAIPATPVRTNFSTGMRAYQSGSRDMLVSAPINILGMR